MSVSAHGSWLDNNYIEKLKMLVPGIDDSVAKDHLGGSWIYNWVVVSSRNIQILCLCLELKFNSECREDI